MTEQPNIKLEILEYVQSSSGIAADLRQFASEKGYAEDRVARKVGELSGLLECGVSPMHPWIIHGKESDVQERIEMYKEQ